MGAQEAVWFFSGIVAFGIIFLIIYGILSLWNVLNDRMSDPNTNFLYKVLIFIPYIIIGCVAGAIYLSGASAVRDWWHKD